ncbi:hypothetical protein JTB14_018031 [Gonioctena quinquepunctata]|nr:hypothetical protein JTB14_018031 [Gonioctena quinquepunctata]
MSLQKTNSKEHQKCLLKGFEGYHRIRSECLRASGGTSVFISSDLYSTYLPLNTDFEAVAVTTWSPNKLTICSIYIPPSHTLTECELVDLIYQLPPPFIIVGDFNAHNEMWGST